MISRSTFKNKFADLNLQKSRVLLKTYTNERIKVVGQLDVQVKYGQLQVVLQLLVVTGNRPALLGRNWLRHIRLNWTAIHAISSSSEEPKHLLDQFAELFSDELGTVTEYHATLDIRNDVRPEKKFHGAQPIPFAIKSAIEEELDKPERSGVMCGYLLHTAAGRHR